MWKYKLYEVDGGWDIKEGVLISKHLTRKGVEKRAFKEACKRVERVYYTVRTQLTPKITIIDYGSYTRFLAIQRR